MITRTDSVPAITGVIFVVEEFTIAKFIPHPELLITVSPITEPELVPLTPSAAVVRSVVNNVVLPAFKVTITRPAVVVLTSVLNEILYKPQGREKDPSEFTLPPI